MYASAATKNKDAGRRRRKKSLLRTRMAFSQSLMVIDSVSKLGNTALLFVDVGLKVDETYYCNLLLPQLLLSAKTQVSGKFICISAIRMGTALLNFSKAVPMRTLHGSFQTVIFPKVV